MVEKKFSTIFFLQCGDGAMQPIQLGKEGVN